MKVNIRDFRAKLSYYLELCKTEPVYITCYGRIVADLKKHEHVEGEL